MKKALALLFVITLLFCALPTNSQQVRKHSKMTLSAGRIEVYYFHFTRRCMTCNAVETETKNILQNLYPKLVKSGRITFKSINLDDASSKTLAQKCAAEGQTLLVMGAGKRIDLTSQGFMYAKSNPEKLKAEIKKAIEPLI